MKRTSPHADPACSELQFFILTASTGGGRISQTERLREDSTIQEIHGMQSVDGEDTVQKFFQSVDLLLDAESTARIPEPMWRRPRARVFLD
jgi:hypothetical protein